MALRKQCIFFLLYFLFFLLKRKIWGAGGYDYDYVRSHEFKKVRQRTRTGTGTGTDKKGKKEFILTSTSSTFINHKGDCRCLSTY